MAIQKDMNEIRQNPTVIYKSFVNHCQMLFYTPTDVDTNKQLRICLQLGQQMIFFSVSKNAKNIKN
jgi:hypothetical protein